MKYKVMHCAADPIYNETSEYMVKKFDAEDEAKRYIKTLKESRFGVYYLKEESEE